MMKTKSLILNCFADYKVDDIVNQHVDMVMKPHGTIDFNHYDDNGIWMPIPIEVPSEKVKPQHGNLKVKYMYLIHLIISTCKGSHKNACYLRSEIYRSIFGHHFGDMLTNLQHMGLISIGNYTPTVSSRPISVENWNIAYMTTYNVRIVELDEKVKRYREEGRNANRYEKNGFSDKYNECLSKLNITDKKSALKFIDDVFTENGEEKNSHKYFYWKSCIEDFEDNPQIKSIDKNGRIYHWLTNLPSSLRQFFNIRYSLDVHNSHPLLFSHFLKEYYNISNNILYNLSLVISHYDGKELRKMLKHNGIDIPKDIPNDVLQYINRVSNGMFYDDFVVIDGFTRQEIKEHMFGEVFYTHKKNSRGLEFAKLFVQMYPNVWHVIRHIRKESHDNLPNMMMTVEAKLFREILEECWHRGMVVINLHDALEILDVEANSFGPNDVISIMVDKYRRHGLYPSISKE